MGILEDVTRRNMEGMGLGLEKGTNVLEALRTGNQLAKTRDDMKTSKLGRQAKQMEMDDYLEGREMRRAKRGAQTVEAQEFVSPTGVKERQVKKEAAIKLTPAQTDFQVKKIMAQTHEMDQEDFYGRTQHLSESSTQEEYTATYKDLPDAYIKNFKLTGKFKSDMQKIAAMQAAAKDNLPHIRELEKLRITASGKAPNKLHKPPKPASVNKPEQLRMLVMQDKDLTGISYFNEQEEVDLFANSVGIRADSIINDSWQKSVAAASRGSHLPPLQPEQALKRAMFTEKALRVKGGTAGIEYLDAEAAMEQQNTWINRKLKVSANLPNVKSKTGMQKQLWAKQYYELYQTERYQRLLTNRSENAAY